MDIIYSRKRLLIPKLKKKNRRCGIKGTTFANRTLGQNLTSVSSGIGGKRDW